MRPLSVLHIASSLRSGGVEGYLSNLCAYLSGRRCRMTVCTISAEAGPPPDWLSDAGARFEHLPLRSLRDLAFPSVRRRLRTIVEEAHPDILHAHLYHAEIVAALATRYTGAPLVVTRHSSGLEFGGARRFIAAAAARRIRRAMAVSDAAALEAGRTGLPARLVTTIPNGVDTTVFRPFEPDLREQERAVLFQQNFTVAHPGTVLVGALGRLQPVKNFSALIRAFSALDAARAGERRRCLMIVGEGPCRSELEDLAGGLGLEGFVSLPGHLDSPAEILPLFDLFALPSLSEGVPLALAEAMACGLPCVASGVGGIVTMLDGAGILVPPGDEQALGAALAGLIGDEAERQRLGRLARVRAMERYDLQSWGERILDLYRSLLA